MLSLNKKSRKKSYASLKSSIKELELAYNLSPILDKHKKDNLNKLLKLVLKI